eukprot:TRINITY_DN66506_c0_g1_i1.p2 TRINITY_DN66506_c0_g1~~TRINITY_DN66506_c0_g1_i1.p2  ORF type:complete len:123 (+),score=10.88 TRINITY_DN66506_c0_g1_i1:1-369(+)
MCFMLISVVGSSGVFTRSAVFTAISPSSIHNHLQGTLLGLDHGMFFAAGVLSPRSVLTCHSSVELSISLASALLSKERIPYVAFRREPISVEGDGGGSVGPDGAEPEEDSVSCHRQNHLDTS